MVSFNGAKNTKKIVSDYNNGDHKQLTETIPGVNPFVFSTPLLLLQGNIALMRP